MCKQVGHNKRTSQRGPVKAMREKKHVSAEMASVSATNAASNNSVDENDTNAANVAIDPVARDTTNVAGEDASNDAIGNDLGGDVVNAGATNDATGNDFGGDVVNGW